MSVRGNTNMLRRLQHTFQSGDIERAMLRAASDESLKLVQMGFRTETDPDGNAWEPLKYRDGMILRRTARMANSFTSRPTPSGFVVGNNTVYTKYHQEGTQGHKAHTRNQAFSADLKFVRSGGKARTRKAGEGRTITRNGRMIHIKPGKELTYKGVAGSYILHFKQGGGKIPIRRMVPASGQLTPRWMTSIDRACTAAGRRVMLQTMVGAT